MQADIALHSIKLLHTAASALFAGCIRLIPILGYLDYFAAAASLAGIVLVLTGLQCPLTNVAARFTDDRRANFDIFLPEWTALHIKAIFGSIYLLRSIFALGRWAGWLD